MCLFTSPMYHRHPESYTTFGPGVCWPRGSRWATHWGLWPDRARHLRRPSGGWAVWHGVGRQSACYSPFRRGGYPEGDAVVQMSSGSKEESTLEHMMRAVMEWYNTSRKSASSVRIRQE
jgi:hypothetical protein